MDVKRTALTNEEIDDLLWSEIDDEATARSVGCGFLALRFGREQRPLQVLRSAAGYYLGTLTADGAPNTRESAEYWKTGEEAEQAKASGHWTQREWL